MSVLTIILVLSSFIIALGYVYYIGRVHGTKKGFKEVIDYFVDNPDEAEKAIAVAAAGAGLKVGWREKEDRLEIVLMKLDADEKEKENADGKQDC